MFKTIKNFIKSTKALSIIEVLVAMSIFTTFGSSVIFIVIDSYYSEAQTNDYAIATQFAQEGIEAVVSIKEENWDNLVAQTGSGSLGIDDTSGYWEFSGSNNVLDKFTRSIEILEVYRENGIGNIVEDTAPLAQLDLATLKIQVTVEWDLPSTQQIQISEYVTYWESAEWIEDLEADFNDGTFVNTGVSVSSGDGNGAIVLGQTGSGTPTFQCIGNTLVTRDIQGNNDALTIVGSGNYIYISQGNQVYVYDVTDPSNPIETDRTSVAANANTIITDGSYIYATTGSNPREFEIIDVQDPNNIAKVGEFDTPRGADGRDVDVVGNTAYVVTDDNAGGGGGPGGGGARHEFYILDISVKSLPVQLSSLEIGANVLGITVEGNYAYIATDDPNNELKIIDISNSLTPTIVAQLDLTGSLTLTDIEYYSGYVFVGTGFFEEDIHIIDVSNPLSPVLNNTITETGANYYRVRIFGNYLFVGSENINDELFIYDVSDPTSPVKQTSKEYGDTVTDAYVLGDTIFISSASNNEELGIYVNTNIDSWACIEQVGAFDVAGTADAEHVIVRPEGIDLLVYVVRGFGTDNQLQIFNINNIDSPVLLGTFTTSVEITDIDLGGNYAYLSTSDDNQELKVIDISNKSTPTQVGSYNTPDIVDATDVKVSGSRAFLSTLNSSASEFYIINIATPSAPTLADPGSVYEANTDINAIAVDGTLVYLATASGNSEFEVLDISVESAPTQVDSLNLSGNEAGNAIWMNSSETSYVYFSDSTGNTMSIIDVSNPASSNELSTYVSPSGQINAITSNGNYVYLATSDPQDEIQTVDVTDKNAPYQLSTFDNNFIPGNDIHFYGGELYLANGDDAEEVKVVARTTIGGSPNTYFSSGSYISSAFDTGSDSNLDSLSWSETIPAGCGGCDIELQVRTAPDNSGTPGTWTDWYGSGGSGTYLTDPLGSTISNFGDGNQWIQYRVEFTSDTSYTPVFNSITIVYN